MADKLIKAVTTEAVKGNNWKKFSNPSAVRGGTAYPKKPADQERFGIRFDYDTVVNKDGIDYHTYKMQANQGKIPSSIKAWRDKNGTDAVMAVVWVKVDATQEEVSAALDDAGKRFKESR
ncbi:hypothetical protein BC629DRAFT_1686867 [Irpex lacteus]|nr:hypothetical protein BC629DRAFT_1686867 [Irpex lacteus]